MNGNFPDSLSAWFGLLAVEPWIWQAFLVVFTTLVLSQLVRRTLLWWAARLQRQTETRWDESLVDALRRPLKTLIWIVGLAFAVDLVPVEEEGTIFEALDSIRDVGIIACVAWFFVRLVGVVEENLLHPADPEATPPDRDTVNLIARLLRASVVITAFLVAMQTLGFSIAGVLALGGVGGIAVGFAARDMLANFFGAIMIYMDRPFRIGDTIRSPDREIMGTVEQIGWRITRILTFENRPLYVPNAAFSTIVIENITRMVNRRINETVGIRYDDVAQLQPIVNEVREMMVNHPAIDTTQRVIVNFNSFGASSLDILIYAYTRTVDWGEYHAAKEDILVKVGDIIERHGAEIAFPTRTLHIVGDGGADGQVPLPSGSAGESIGETTPHPEATR